MLSMQGLLFMVLVVGVEVSQGYFADWSLLARDRQPTCVDIPANMTLCQNIGKWTTVHSSKSDG
jgi:hypothetical protein